MGLLLGIFAGCAPIPHTTVKSFEVRGRVLEARTRAPIQGARIFFTVQSDSEGYFKLKETRNFHFAVTAPEGDLPSREFWWSHVTISQANHLPRRLDDDFWDKGEVLLEPKP